MAASTPLATAVADLERADLGSQLRLQQQLWQQQRLELARPLQQEPASLARVVPQQLLPMLRDERSGHPWRIFARRNAFIKFRAVELLL